MNEIVVAVLSSSVLASLISGIFQYINNKNARKVIAYVKKEKYQGMSITLFSLHMMPTKHSEAMAGRMGLETRLTCWKETSQTKEVVYENTG